MENCWLRGQEKSKISILEQPGINKKAKLIYGMCSEVKILDKRKKRKLTFISPLFFFFKERGMSLEGGVQSLDFGQSYFRKLNTVQLLF